MSQVKGAPEDERLSLRCSAGGGRNGEVRRNAPFTLPENVHLEGIPDLPKIRARGK